MSDFWNKKGITTQDQAYQQAPQIQPQQVVLDEAAFSEIENNEDFDLFEDEDESMESVLSDANLRLEQGRLYQMIMTHDLFGDTNADPRAIKNVQRWIRKAAKDQMELLLGMRQEQKTPETIVSSPFNDMEVNVLKLLASKMSKGATDNPEPAPQPVAQSPKKDGITSISGNIKPTFGTPLRKENKLIAQKPKVQEQKVTKTPPKSVEKEQVSAIDKPIDQMTPQELAEHDKNASDKYKKMHSAMPTNMVPHPSPQQLEAMYTVQANQISGPGSAIGNVMALMGKR